MRAGGATGDRRIGHLIRTIGLLAIGLLAVLVVGLDAWAQGPTPRIAPGIVLDLNLPAYRIEVQEQGAVTHRFLVAIGARRYPTPVGDFTIGRLIWNPIWVPPESPWARGETITPPGPSNPMRKVKLQLDGPYYVHGTPLVASLGHAASHGCIRMDPDDAVALARILQRRTGAPISEAATDSLTRQSRPTREVALPAPVLFRIRYEIAEVRDDTLTVYPDVYNRMRGDMYGAVMTSLASAGVDTAHVARDVLRTVLNRAARRAVHIPLDSVVHLEALAPRGGHVTPHPAPSTSLFESARPGCEIG